jgi:hypothetical protein
MEAICPPKTSVGTRLHGVISQKIRTLRNILNSSIFLRKWVDNIKIDLGEIGWRGVDWIRLAQDRDRWRTFANAVMNIRVP